MTDNWSKLVAGAYTVNFRADDRYSVTWGLFKAKSLAFPDGEGIIGWGGHSTTELDISGFLVTDLGGDGSTDKQIFDILLPLTRDTQRAAVPGVCTLYLGHGSVVLTGWVRNFIVDSDAPDGQELVRVTFNMLLKLFPVYTGD